MPRYYCDKCKKVWSSGGFDFKVVAEPCPAHAVEKAVEAVRQVGLGAPPGVWRAQQLRLQSQAPR